MAEIAPLTKKRCLIDGATWVASAPVDAATLSACKLAAAHNSFAWPLDTDLTTKVFLMLDTKSVCCAAATCSFFNKCASDPLCYANIDLTRSANGMSDTVVSTMIQRAGNSNLQSIKLGSLSHDKKASEKSLLTSSCLSVLVLDEGAIKLPLRQLHLYNLEMSSVVLHVVLSACQSLVKLEIVGVDIWFTDILTTICKNCHSIEWLLLDIGAIGHRRIFMEDWELQNTIKSSPRLSYLALRGYNILDNQLYALIKGACCLKSLDLSESYGFSGVFLRWWFNELGTGGGGDSLETLILRDCINLRAREVSDFLAAILDGDRKALRYVDISNRRCLLYRFNCQRAIDVPEVLQERSDIHLIADYPPKLYLSPQSHMISYFVRCFS